MRFTWIPAALVLAFTGVSACTLSWDASPLEATNRAPTPPSAALIRFAHEGTITLAPGELRQVQIVASPATRYDVRFSLIGDALDGWIERAAVQTDADGTATVALHAPNRPTTFHLRASVVLDDGAAGPSAEASVAVSAQGFGTLHALPQYTGKRAVATWTASVVARTTCADLAALLPGEPPGALVSNAPLGTPLLVPNAPVGPNLAVAVRAGHYAWGCADTTDLKADGTLDVKVTIVDKPIDLGATDLDVTLTYQPEAADYGALIGGATELLRDAFLPKGPSEAELVLAAMRGAAPGDQAIAFDEARKAQGWDALCAAHVAALPTSLRERTAAWIAAGMLAQAPRITGHLGAKGGSPGTAELRVLTIGSVDAAVAGVPPTSPFAWTADPDDTLILGGIVLWQPSRFVGAAGLAGAKLEQPGAVTMADALAHAADCSGLAAELSGFPTCDASCLAALCKKGLDDRWSLGLAASTDAGHIGHLTITASGPAQLDDTAEPSGVKGNWLGTVTDGVVAAKVKGFFEATVPPAAPPP
jgi:hypothetical protein